MESAKVINGIASTTRYLADAGHFRPSGSTITHTPRWAPGGPATVAGRHPVPVKAVWAERGALCDTQCDRTLPAATPGAAAALAHRALQGLPVKCMARCHPAPQGACCMLAVGTFRKPPPPGNGTQNTKMHGMSKRAGRGRRCRDTHQLLTKTRTSAWPSSWTSSSVRGA